VASLLEVGTGFHNELTGRENIFLNGAILGMRREETRRKFDEIVAFAEVEKFLDTPVKRYSSGMYMRLAFAVAAHLEPEILIVDEVLSVGDMEFQRKCLGKMEQVSKAGRTVLFVSHNMAAVKSLSTRAVVLESGRVAFDGSAVLAVECYSRYRESATRGVRSWGRGVHTAILGARLLDQSGDPVTDYTPGELLTVEVTFETDGTTGLSLDLFLLDGTRQKLGMASSSRFHGLTLPKHAGCFRTRLELPPLWLASGRYRVDLATSVPNLYRDHVVEDALEFEVVSSNPGGLSYDFKQSMNFGTIALPFVTLPRWMAVGFDDQVEPLFSAASRVSRTSS
jgi:lipopolysaccharide transport system ATP-binding protein